jgi:hypothetical protein
VLLMGCYANCSSLFGLASIHFCAFSINPENTAGSEFSSLLSPVDVATLSS